MINKNILIYFYFFLDAKDVVDTSRVSELREKVCMSLASYCKKVHSDDVARFAKLLLRMPPIRGWCIKGIENLFFAGAARSADADIIHMIRIVKVSKTRFYYSCEIYSRLEFKTKQTNINQQVFFFFFNFNIVLSYVCCLVILVYMFLCDTCLFKKKCGKVFKKKSLYIFFLPFAGFFRLFSIIGCCIWCITQLICFSFFLEVYIYVCV